MIEVLAGLEPFVIEELKHLGASHIEPKKTEVRCTFAGNPQELNALRTAVAVYRQHTFAVPRPKALLGHEHLSVILKESKRIQQSATFRALKLSAAGKDSAIFTRLLSEISRATALPVDANEGDLLLRVRRAANAGWDVLWRLTPRPLSARAWRVCNLAGGLNAGVAAAMVTLARAEPKDVVFNAMCGSGTLLIEQATTQNVAQLLGYDTDPAALACAQTNVQAAKLNNIALHLGNATETQLADASVDVITCDPPWGDAVGTHANNSRLYPKMLAEFKRILRPGGRLVLLTHELKFMQAYLTRSQTWHVAQEVQVFHGGHHPRIYLLKP